MTMTTTMTMTIAITIAMTIVMTNLDIILISNSIKRTEAMSLSDIYVAKLEKR